MKCFVFLSRSHSGDQICLLKIISVQWLLFEFLILCDVCNFALVYSISVTDKDMNRFPYLLELAYCFCNFQNIFSIASLTICHLIHSKTFDSFHDLRYALWFQITTIEFFLNFLEGGFLTSGRILEHHHHPVSLQEYFFLIQARNLGISKECFRVIFNLQTTEINSQVFLSLLDN